MTTERICAGLALLVSLLGLIFAGFANEQVKQVLIPFDRVILLCGFIIGVGTTARWVMRWPSFWTNRKGRK
jgi:hypothetical protein